MLCAISSPSMDTSTHNAISCRGVLNVIKAFCTSYSNDFNSDIQHMLSSSLALTSPEVNLHYAIELTWTIQDYYSLLLIHPTCTNLLSEHCLLKSIFFKLWQRDELYTFYFHLIDGLQCTTFVMINWQNRCVMKAQQKVPDCFIKQCERERERETRKR